MLNLAQISDAPVITSIRLLQNSAKAGQTSFLRIHVHTEGHLMLAVKLP